MNKMNKQVNLRLTFKDKKTYEDFKRWAKAHSVNLQALVIAKTSAETNHRDLF